MGWGVADCTAAAQHTQWANRSVISLSLIYGLRIKFDRFDILFIWVVDATSERERRGFVLVLGPVGRCGVYCEVAGLEISLSCDRVVEVDV